MKKIVWFVVSMIFALVLIVTTVLFIGSSINWQDKIGSHLDRAEVWAQSENISDREVASELGVVLAEVEKTSWLQDVPAVKTWYIDLVETRNALVQHPDSLDSIVERSSVEFGYIKNLAPEGMDIFPYRYRELLKWLFGISLVGLIICICLISEAFGDKGKVKEEGLHEEKV